MTVRVLDPVKSAESPHGRARRKGPGGIWEVLIDGKWVSEGAVVAWEATQRHGSQVEAARALGLSPPALNARLAVYAKATGHTGPRPGASAGRGGGPRVNGSPAIPEPSAPSAPFDSPPPRPAPDGWKSPPPPAPKAEPPDKPPAPDWRMVTDRLIERIAALEAKPPSDDLPEAVTAELDDIASRLHAVERHALEFGETGMDELQTRTYRLGYRVGWLVAGLTLIAEGSDPAGAAAIAKAALEPPDPPWYPG